VRPELQERLDELSQRVGLERIDPRVLVAGVALALVAAVFVGKWMAGTSSAGVEMPASAPAVAAPPASVADATSSVEASIVVHVVGAVRHPGVYRLPPGSRSENALLAAGGALGSAQLAAVNLAAPLADGEQVVVPMKGEVAPAAAPTPAGASGGAQAPAPGQKVDLNTASEAELDTLPGVGPATATRIIEDRRTNGPFRAPEDLMRVPGIGPKKFDALKDLVRT